MKTLYTLYALLFYSISIYAQNTMLHGRVLYQNSGLKPAIGVSISTTKGANNTYTKDGGYYKLIFDKNRVGTRIKLIVGTEDQYGVAIEVVNNKEVEYCLLPVDPADSMLIIVCPLGQRDIAAKRYYHILETDTKRQLAQLKLEINKLLIQKNSDNKNIIGLIKKQDALQKSLNEGKSERDSLANYIASINLDMANELVRSAVKKLDEEDDVEGALNILDQKKMAIGWRQSQSRKDKADKELKEWIRAFELHARLAEPLFKYKDVFESYKELISIYEANHYSEEILVDYYIKAGAIKAEDGDYKECITYSEKAMSLIDNILHLTDSTKRREINKDNIAETYRLLKAMSIAASNSGNGYRSLGNLNKALENFQFTETFKKMFLKEDNPDFALSYNNISTIYTGLHDYKTALEYCNKALKYQDKLLPDKFSILIKIYNNTAENYRLISDYEKAKAFGEKALKIAQVYLKPNDPMISVCYNNLSVIFRDLNDTINAIEYLNKSISIMESSLSPNHPSLATLYNNSAIQYINQKKYDKALEYLQKAVDINNVTLPDNHIDFATIYNNFANVYISKMYFFKALEYTQKAYKILENSPKSEVRNHNWIILVNNSTIIFENIGDYYFYNKKYDLSAQAYTKVIYALPKKAVLYMNRGACYDYLKQYDKALDDYHMALSLDSTYNTSDTYLNNVSYIYVEMKLLDKAKEYLQKFETIYVNNPLVYRNWAAYFAQQNKIDQALENLRKSVALGYDNLTFLTSEECFVNLHNKPAFKQLIRSIKVKNDQNQSKSKN